MREQGPGSPENHEESFLLLGIREIIGDKAGTKVIEFVGTRGESAQVLSMTASAINWKVDTSVTFPVVEIKPSNIPFKPATESVTITGSLEDLSKFLANLGFATILEKPVEKLVETPK